MAPNNPVDRPLVSVIVTTYNQDKYVQSALRSALDQTYKKLEIVVSDDASHDSTEKVIRETVDHYQREDGRHKILVNFNDKNLGICKNFELAFGMTQGEIVFAFGGDDISTPNRVDVIVSEWIRDGKKPRVYASGGWLMDVDGQIRREYGIEVMQGAPVGAFNAYPRRVFDDFPKIQDKLATLTYEDSVYGSRAEFFESAKYVDVPLVKYRIGSGVSTGGDWLRKMVRGAIAVKASCEQLLIDLQHIEKQLPDDFRLSKRSELEKRIQHESSFLRLLTGGTFSERLLGYQECQYGKLPLKNRILGCVLLLPLPMSGLALRALQSLNK